MAFALTQENASSKKFYFKANRENVCSPKNATMDI